MGLDEKRSILMNWAWTEYLIDPIDDDRPESDRRSRLHDVELALLALENGPESNAASVFACPAPR